MEMVGPGGHNYLTKCTLTSPDDRPICGINTNIPLQGWPIEVLGLAG